jgi:hypothetical protein
MLNKQISGVHQGAQRSKPQHKKPSDAVQQAK